jgi:CDP-4-dehydro-6-deoxyglucose reductase
MFGLFGGNKDWQAKVNGGEHTITVKAGDNLLNAALSQGVPWPHDCRVGSCSTCQCTLKGGKIKALTDFSYVLDQDQLKSGTILACQTRLKSDIEIEVELGDAPAIALNSYEGKILSARNMTHDIKELVIKCDGNVEHSGMAGQYSEISISAIDDPRSYSYAKAPKQENPGEFTFYVRLVPNGKFTEWLFAEDRTGEPVKVTGPYGQFYRREEDSTMVCVAGGSGMSAIKAILESSAAEQVKRNCLYLFGARAQQDLYCMDELAEIGKKWNKDYSFEFVPVLSEEPDGSGWQGATGFVTTYLKEAYVDTGKISMSNAQGYLCGPPPMIDAAIDVMVDQGLDKENIFFDKFLDASSMPGGR